MARPPKEGLDYFLLDCALDDKFRLVEAEFGLTGFGVVVKLLQKIYGQCGYYVEWTNEVALLFAADCRVGGSVVSEIVSASIKRGIFDSEIFEKYQVLTSRGIQKRYLEAVKRRKILTLINQYLLVNVASILDNVSINAVYVDINSENERNNPQSKVEESKEESFLPPIASGDEKPKKKKNEKITYADDSPEMQLALLLSSEIRKNKPDWIMQGNIQSWCDTFRLILNRDKRNYDDVVSMIKFCQWDTFWMGNILSPDKLRKQYDTLAFKREEARRKLEQRNR